jgi:hypothetical protein
VRKNSLFLALTPKFNDRINPVKHHFRQLGAHAGRTIDVVHNERNVRISLIRGLYVE